jgi:hypothetical protein
MMLIVAFVKCLKYTLSCILLFLGIHAYKMEYFINVPFFHFVYDCVQFYKDP